MTTEEKVKAYDVALKVIKGNLDALNEITETGAETVNIQSIKNCFYKAFPELKESEDERIRKFLIGLLSSGTWRKEYPFSPIDCVAWLEKQDEQPSAIRWYDVSLIPQETEELLVECNSEDAKWHEIAFYHADTKTFWNGTRQVENVTRWCYIIDLPKKQKEHKPVQTIEEKEYVRTLKGLISDFIRDCGGGIIDTEYYQKIYNWMDGKHIEQKPAEWSEEDKRKLNRIYEILGYAADDKGFLTSKRIIGDNEAIELQDFLKSLRPQPHTVSIKDATKFGNLEYERGVKDGIQHAKNHQWKPSEGQMLALSETIAFAPDTFKPKCTLITLQDELKKLMEEQYENGISKKNCGWSL
jgi:hypothetical protein